MIPTDLHDVRQRLITDAQQLGLTPHADQLAAAAAPCIRLFHAPDDLETIDFLQSVKQDDPTFAGDDLQAIQLWRNLMMRRLPIGASRIGGLPDLPPSIAWPTNRLGAKLHLAAQLDCALLPRIPGYPLPTNGWLYFFVENGDREFPLPCAVFHYSGPVQSLIRAPESSVDGLAPSGKRRELQPMYPIDSAITSFCLPSPDGEGGNQLPDWSADPQATDAYFSLADDRAAIPQPMSQLAVLFGLGGFDEMTSSELVNTYGKIPGDDWTLLLTIETQRGARGNSGWLGEHALQIYIRRSDLARGDFSHCYATSGPG